MKKGYSAHGHRLPRWPICTWNAARFIYLWRRGSDPPSKSYRIIPCLFHSDVITRRARFSITHWTECASLRLLLPSCCGCSAWQPFKATALCDSLSCSFSFSHAISHSFLWLKMTLVCVCAFACAPPGVHTQTQREAVYLFIPTNPVCINGSHH